MLSRISCAKTVVAILAVVAVLTYVGAAQADTISIVMIPSTNSLANCGISSANTYTHAIDFSYEYNAINPVTINGVAFTGTRNVSSGNSPKPWSFTTKAKASGYGNEANEGVDGAFTKTTTYKEGTADSDPLRLMLFGFTYCTDAAGNNPRTFTLTLSGLTAGTHYSARVYYRTFVLDDSDRFNVVTGNNGGTLTQLTTNCNATNSGAAVARYLDYDYVASGTSITIKTEQSTVNSGAWLWYGMSNQVVIPEPSTLALLGCGLIGLLCYAWRKRR